MVQIAVGHRFACFGQGRRVGVSTHGLLEEFAMYRRGEAAEVESGVNEALGRPARSFEEFARDYAPLFS